VTAIGVSGPAQGRGTVKARAANAIVEIGGSPHKTDEQKMLVAGLAVLLRED